MFGRVVRKELLDTALSPRFMAMFGIGLTLTLLSLFTGIRNHLANERFHAVATELMRETVPNQVSWQALASWGEYHVFKRPSTLGMLVGGLENDLGRSSIISLYDEPILDGSKHAEQPVFAIFGGLDFLFSVQVVFSLLALLFTYDSICGERESGTLKLMLANALPRDTILFGKFAGGLVGIGMPLLFTMAVAALVLMAHPELVLGSGGWTRVLALFSLCFVYLACFLALGLLISSLTRRRSTALLVALIVWVLLVFVLPKATVLVSGHTLEVPSSAEIQEQKGELVRASYREYLAWRQQWLRSHPGTHEIPADVLAANQDERQQARDLASSRIDEEYEQLQAAQERLARNLGRISPAASLSFAALEIADTGLGRKRRFLDAARAHRAEFSVWVNERIHEDRRRPQTSDGSSSRGRLDVADMPEFRLPRATVSSHLMAAIPDASVLLFLLFGLLGAAHLRFLRYDPR